MCLNPEEIDYLDFASKEAFFSYYNVGIIIAEEQAMATAIAQATSEDVSIQRIIQKIVKEEQKFSCRVGLASSGKKKKTGQSRRERSSLKPELPVDGSVATASVVGQSIGTGLQLFSTGV